MGYMHIDNLYKAQEILAFKTCFALEKIHGTSAHILWNNGQLDFHSGGEPHERFKALFQVAALVDRFNEQFSSTTTVRVHGEAYGGKQQGMSKTYGPDLKFIVFDIKVGDWWLSVPHAHGVAKLLGLDFVDWVEIPATLESIDAERDRFSVQALRNGLGEHIREGVVLRPPFEVTLNGGKRLIAKHKRAEFAEMLPKVVDPAKSAERDEADLVAQAWVTPMRLEHVINQLVSGRDDKEVRIQDTGRIIKLMVEDVMREGAGEIAETPPVRKAIGGLAGKLFKLRLMEMIGERP